MTMNIEFVKRHWIPITGGLVGILVLYYLLKNLGGGSTATASTPDISGGDASSMNLAAAASLQNAQVNGQITVAAYQAQVQTAGISAALQDSLAKTAAQLSATNLQTQSSTAIAIGDQTTAVSIQQIQSDAAVAQTQIQGNTIAHIADVSAQATVLAQQSHDSILKSGLSFVATQIADVLGKGNRQTTLSALAPIIAAELGQQGSSAAASAANAQIQTAHSPGATLSGIASIAAGLFS